MTRVGYWLDRANIAGGGTGPYAWRVLEALLGRHDPEWQFVIFCQTNRAEASLELARRYRSAAQVCAIPGTFPLPRRILGRVGKWLSPSNGLDPWRRWFSSQRIDVLHVPYSYAPPGRVSCPWLFTMHDVQELYFPEFFTAQERALRAERSWKAFEACAGVVVSFAHVKRDVIKYFQLPEAMVHVCSLPFEKIHLREPTAAAAASFRAKYRDGYLLYPAQTWPHKNHLGLIRAVERIKDKTGRTVTLLCTGRKNPKFQTELEAHLQTSSVAGQVHFLDVVAEEELCWLYRHCALVVIPTLYEAGSFPLLEAMSLEVPVICSAVTSLPETIGDARFTFDPRDVEDMARLIMRMLDDTGLRAANVQNGMERTKLLRRQDAFPGLEAAWRNTLSRPARCA